MAIMYIRTYIQLNRGIIAMQAIIVIDNRETTDSQEVILSRALCPICGGNVTQNGPITRCLLCRYTYCESCEGESTGEHGCFPIG